jgi:hypothetical protein
MVQPLAETVPSPGREESSTTEGVSCPPLA